MRAVECENLAFVELLLAHGANPNVERAEHEDARAGETALSFARDAATATALLDAGADPDVLVSTSEGICLLREAMPPPLRRLIDARHPRPPASGLVGAWRLAAVQRAPGGLSEEELEESYIDEYRVGFPFEGESAELHMYEDGRVTLNRDGYALEDRWELSPNGFTLRGPTVESNYSYDGLGTDREAWLQGDVLVLWIGDRRYHFRRPGSFRREAILRTDPARIPAIARSVLE